MRRAFLSHSTKDDHYVAELESFLRAAGLSVFNDSHSIQPDEQFWPKIQKGIAGCDTLIVVITAATQTSTWVTREVGYARSLQKQVIPLWVEDCTLPVLFSDRDVIDLRPRSRALIRTDISRILKYAPAQLIGREEETKRLNEAWQKTLRMEKGRPHILTFVALGGEGKTSLVAKWAAELAAQDWPGCAAAFAWSFYSQGTREQQAASSDLFLKEALNFFALDDKDREFAASPAGTFEKGQRLARLVGQRRSLLILDGLEPLQYAPSSTAFPPGQLKDQGVAKLLKDLATASHGLCVVTTRYSLPDLKAFWQTTAPEVKLLRLSRDAGVHLLKTLGVRGTAQELAALVEDVKGHALTLTLLGGFLKRAFHGDIRQRDRVKFEKADEEIDGGHAFRVLDAYVNWLEPRGFRAWFRRLFSESERKMQIRGRRFVAVLRLMGLFDRPADAGCLHVLLQLPAVPGLTEPLAELADDDWEYCLSGLEAARLLTVSRDASGALVSLDAHPQLREYFARQLRSQQPDAWRAAHRRLYEHLCATTKEGDQPTLEDLQPLYQAVAHGCQAGLQQKACDGVYRDRIMRGSEAYPVHILGAFGSELGAIACFFEQPWNRISPSLIEPIQAWLLNEAAVRLRALGRLTEALELFKEYTQREAAAEHWEHAAVGASNLCGLELTLGKVAGAAGVAEQCMAYADRSGDAYWQCFSRTTYADALHQSGHRAEAETRFREAEQMQQKMQPDHPLLSGLGGFRYCDLLLAAPERAAWRVSCSGGLQPQEESVAHSTTLWAVYLRAFRTLKRVEQMHIDILRPSLDHLTLGRAAFYEAILGKLESKKQKVEMELACRELDAAMSGLRRAGQQDHLPRGLLSRAWLHFLEGKRTGFDSAQADLDEAWEIAERGPMRLHMTDIHLHRARLFFREATYPWESPAADLAAARKLIEQCGYGRRKEEFEDAEVIIRQQCS